MIRGSHHTQESRQKNSDKHIGKVPWNKNKKGAIAWNKGLTMNDPRVKQYTLKGGISKKGKHYSPRTEFKKGMVTWNRNKETPEATRKKQSISKIIFYKEHPEAIDRWYEQTRKNLVLPVKDTKIERKIQAFLKRLGITFLTHQHMNIAHGYQCDILIPAMNLVIECNGTYWHKYPVGNDLDHIRTKELIEKGFKVLRLWEFEIKKMTPEQLKDRINL